MRKIYYYLLLASVIISCDGKEELTSKTESHNNPTQTYIINGDIPYVSEITDGSKPTKPILLNHFTKEKLNNEINGRKTSKISETSAFIDFNYGIVGSTNSGCTIDYYVHSTGKYYTTDSGVYGFNPYLYNGYLIRGFGVPHHNHNYNSLVLIASNRGVTKSSRGRIYNDNVSRGAAISIEYLFKANVTYEISIQTYFIDIENVIDKQKESEGYPTLYAQLKDSGILVNGPSACDENGVFRIIESNPNNVRSYTLENNIKVQKTIVYKFSPIESKNALILALHPTTSGQRGPDVKIPNNAYTMLLKNITITEKPFDPSLNTEISSGGRRL